MRSEKAVNIRIYLDVFIVVVVQLPHCFSLNIYELAAPIARFSQPATAGAGASAAAAAAVVYFIIVVLPRFWLLRGRDGGKMSLSMFHVRKKINADAFFVLTPALHASLHFGAECGNLAPSTAP